MFLLGFSEVANILLTDISPCIYINAEKLVAQLYYQPGSLWLEKVIVKQVSEEFSAVLSWPAVVTFRCTCACVDTLWSPIVTGLLCCGLVMCENFCVYISLHMHSQQNNHFLYLDASNSSGFSFWRQMHILYSCPLPPTHTHTHTRKEKASISKCVVELLWWWYQLFQSQKFYSQPFRKSWY